MKAAMSQRAILIIYAILGWAICGATIGIGRRYLSMDAALYVHAAVAPLAFGILARLFYKKFPSSSAIATASTMLGVVVGLDAFVVAPLFEHSFAMFESILGTWVPFGFIFLASYLVGRAGR